MFTDDMFRVLYRQEQGQPVAPGLPRELDMRRSHILSLESWASSQRACQFWPAGPLPATLEKTP
jgi:hypothetical protein